MKKDNFPPLPRPFDTGSIPKFSAEQMREYARLVAEECAKLCDDRHSDACAYRIRESFGVKT